MFWGLLAFHLLHAHPHGQYDYLQNVRPKDFQKWAMGTIGWIIAGLTVSQSGLSDFPILPESKTLGTTVQFQLAAVISAIYGVFSFTLCQPTGGPRQIR